MKNILCIVAFVLNFIFFSFHDFAQCSEYTISTIPQWNGSGFTNAWGTHLGAYPSFGQTFSAPVVAGGTQLTSYSLYFLYAGGSEQYYKLYVYNWGGANPTGNPIYVSNTLTASTSFIATKVTNNIPNIPLSPGGQYIAIISTLGISNSLGEFLLGYVNPSTYSDGNLYRNTSDSLTSNWQSGPGGDLAFELTAISN